jgi:hypothetical protein
MFGCKRVIDMSERKLLTLSERCRVLAQECRAKGQSFRNEKPRTQMFQLAADYERNAKLSEAWETSLRVRHDQETPLIPKISETFVQQSKE